MSFVSYVSQNIIQGPSFAPRLEVRHFQRRFAGEAVRWLLEGQFPWNRHQVPIPVGITLDPDSSQQITSIALSTPTRGVLISIDGSSLRELKMIPNDTVFLSLMRGEVRFRSSKKSDWTCEDGEEYMNSFVLVGFDVARTAVLLLKYVGVRFRGVDLGSLIAPEAMTPWTPGRLVRGRVKQDVDQWKVDKCWNESGSQDAFYLRAWISQCIAERCQTEINSATRIDTINLNAKEHECVQAFVWESFQVDQLKPREVQAAVSDITTRKDGRLDVKNDNYKNKIRRGERQTVRITTTEREYNTRARGVKGKRTTLGALNISGQIQSILVVGRQDPTNSERLAEFLLLCVLQGKKTFQKSPFIRLFWFPHWKTFRPPADSAASREEIVRRVLDSAQLNPAQEEVVRKAQTNERVLVVHGPPGTGKTTTIAAISRIWDLHDCPVWIIAHSNVAVKNIALSLHKRQVDFKIIVSKEFYEEWHEHLYGAVQDNLIRSDELPDSNVAMERVIGGSCIILSTLGMLSNPGFEKCGLFKLVPVERLIVDEASQIRIFEFLHLFELFQNVLEKVIFFGDPHQLPPHNHDSIEDMKTVFDLEHLNTPHRRFLLNVQYRLPVALGSFISSHVYGNELQSVHDDTSSSCVLFVNVPAPHGSESKLGNSSKNDGEIATVVNLVKKYYHNKDFAVITPYDAQRGEIEKGLKAEGLTWENSVFNVDSFQGNERNYIIVSLVRTDMPGFLSHMNRINVMLTRCKKGLVIVANRDFLNSNGYNTLVATFGRHWTRTYGDGAWVDWREVAGGSVDVPGVPAPSPGLRRFAVPSQPASYGYRSTVSAKYEGSTGGFDVSKLFRKKQEHATQHNAIPPSAPSHRSTDSFDDYPQAASWDIWNEDYNYEDSWADSPESFTSDFLFPPLVSFSQGRPMTKTRRPFEDLETSFPALSSGKAPPRQTSNRLHTHSLVGKTASAWNRPMPRPSQDPVTSSNRFSVLQQGSTSTRSTGQTKQTAASTPSFGTHRSKAAPSPRTPSSTQFGSGGIGGFTPVASRQDDVGWTRVERRRGYGRKKNFRDAPAPAPAPQPATSKRAWNRQRRYRYWGMD